jgi:hypothetical protein
MEVEAASKTATTRFTRNCLGSGFNLDDLPFQAANNRFSGSRFLRALESVPDSTDGL